MHGRVTPRLPTRGFTLIELMVAMAIVGLVLTITLVAIRGVRERARRLQCQNQMRQVALACLQFEGAKGVLPLDHSFPTQILPLLEISLPADLQQHVAWPRLSCPADPGVERVSRNVSYRANEGTNSVAPNANGVLWRKLSDITDGLSNTAMISERLAYGEDPLHAAAHPVEPVAIRYPWTNEFEEDPAAAAQSCRTRRLTQAGLVLGLCFTTQGFLTHGYTHRLLPNEAPCVNSSLSNFGSIERPLLPATSLHRGGVNVSFCDGSVRTVASNIDEQVWMALGTIADGEVTTPDR